MRMFAGPNGSGKSVLKAHLADELLGHYLNPDDVEALIKRDRSLDFASFGITTSAAEVLHVFANSKLLHSKGLASDAARLRFANTSLAFGPVEVNSYFASVAVAFMRRKLLEVGSSFSLETVMSHPSKVDLLADAQRAGYRTYLYYIATNDPVINVSRVQNRVLLGGHPVPADKIVSRYHRSLDLLFDAIKHTNRAYIFDNSTDNADRQHTWLAEITDGRILELKSNLLPTWFVQAVLDKI